MTTDHSPIEKITSATVHDSFNDEAVVMHYARAAHQLGLWASERLLIEQWFPDKTAPQLEVGCGAGRVAFGLWDLGYQNLTAVDFADELLDQARRLAALRAVDAIRFIHADATELNRCHLLNDKVPRFAGALFMFNGMMQIPGRENRRQTLREIRAVCRPGARFLFTTHDREDDLHARLCWADEAARWARGGQDPRLIEFGDRWFENDLGGRTFMHLPVRTEVLEDLAATGWLPLFDAMRRTLAPESAAVREFSDECRFWLVQASLQKIGGEGLVGGPSDTGGEGPPPSRDLNTGGDSTGTSLSSCVYSADRTRHLA
jgi:SAM-dependent methyltransferase